jgi:hypothetical protein
MESSVWLLINILFTIFYVFLFLHVCEEKHGLTEIALITRVSVGLIAIIHNIMVFILV